MKVYLPLFQDGKLFLRGLLLFFLTLPSIFSSIWSLQVMLTSVLSWEIMHHVNPHQNIMALLHLSTSTCLYTFSAEYLACMPTSLRMLIFVQNPKTHSLSKKLRGSIEQKTTVLSHLSSQSHSLLLLSTSKWSCWKLHRAFPNGSKVGLQKMSFY